MNRTIFKVVIDPKAPFPKPVTLVRKSSDKDWKVVVIGAQHLEVSELTMTEKALKQAQVIGTWEVPEGAAGA